LNLFMCLNCEIKDLDPQYVFNCPSVLVPCHVSNPFS
jgi:hypothetical protein